MNYDYFNCEIDDGVAVISFRNASAAAPEELADEFRDLMLRLQADNAVRVVLTDDADSAFTFGADRRNLACEREQNEGTETLISNMEIARSIVNFCQELAKPVIAAASGDIRGDGFGFYLAADVRLATNSATFSPPSLVDGLLPDWGVSYALPRLMGPGRTLELLWSGRSLSAAEAFSLGLVDRLIESDQWEESVMAFARKVAQIPQPALRLSKLASQQYTHFDLTAMLAYEQEAQQQCWNGIETNEGLAALLENRQPDFSILPEDDN